MQGAPGGGHNLQLYVGFQTQVLGPRQSREATYYGVEKRGEVEFSGGPIKSPTLVTKKTMESLEETVAF